MVGSPVQVVACPPPPPPGPTPDQSARVFWNRVEEVCLVRLAHDTLAPSALPLLRDVPLAEGRWQVHARIESGLKGRCEPGVVHFADVPPAVCGGGMPPLDVPLIAGWTIDRVMTVWTPSESALADALRRLAARR